MDRNVVVNKLCFSYTVAFNYQTGYTLLCTVVLLGKYSMLVLPLDLLLVLPLDLVMVKPMHFLHCIV